MRFTSSVAALGAVSLLALTSCSSGTPEAASESSVPQEENASALIVTPIDVYADLVSGVVGETAEVEAFVTSAAVDPHSYEATPQDRLLVDRADVVVANGGGYDSFITLLADSADLEGDVYQLIEGDNEHSHDHHGGFENEHIWYDLPRMSEFVQDFAVYMGERLPDHADDYQDNAAELAAQIDELATRNEALETENMAFFSTEAVSGALLEDAGFEDLTDSQFLSAVEHGDDVSPRLYQDALNIVGGEEISLLAYNPQTETNQSARIREAAEDNNVPVLEFSETFPDGAEGYVEWMSTNIDQVEELIQEQQGESAE